ncbi:MAG: protein kinase [Planctomycetota bacterium]
MPLCPSCSATLPDADATGDGSIVCPACGATIVDGIDVTVTASGEPTGEQQGVNEEPIELVLSEDDDAEPSDSTLPPDETPEELGATISFEDSDNEALGLTIDLAGGDPDAPAIDLTGAGAADGEAADADILNATIDLPDAGKTAPPGGDATVAMRPAAGANSNDGGEDLGATVDMPDLGKTATPDSDATIALPSGPTVGPTPTDGDPPHDATLAFDSTEATGRAPTPQPLHLTGLSGGESRPIGTLGGGRGSASVRTGESQLVGAESVRLRAFQIDEPDAQPETGVDYAIEGTAGQGGMGVVYKARQTSLDRLVALKQIKGELGATQNDCNKFVSEAVITGQLEHPNIAPVHDLGLALDGLPFYAMKFVEGEDWEDSIDQLHESENLSILIQVSQAIAFAHSREVIHRDLKPGNVRLGGFGEVLVMDWGLAARLGEGKPIQPAGTPIYMPPETALEYLDHARERVGGKPIAASRRRVPAGKHCDVYLLGALLFRIVAGRAPHRGKNTFECLRNAAQNEIQPAGRRSELLDIAYRAMATEPEDRYATATEFIDALRAYQAHAQSIRIAKTASSDLREAERLRGRSDASPSATYDSYSRAQHGFQNALDLWDGNRKARRRLKQTKRRFAETAYANGDFDLSLSLLDDERPEDAELRASVATSRRSRRARLAWFKTLQYATVASLVVALGFITWSEVLRRQAATARADLALARREAEVVERDAQNRIDEANRTVAAAKKSVAAAEEEATRAIAEGERVAAAQVASAERESAERVAAAEREADRRTAEADREVARLAEDASRQAYFAELGRVRATLSDLGQYAAWKRLQEAPDEIAAFGADDPAWRALRRAANWTDEATEIATKNGRTLTAASPDGRFLAIAWEAVGGRMSVEVRDTRTNRAIAPIARLDAGPVSAIAISENAQWVALAGEELAVLDVANGALTQLDPRRARGVAAVAFDPVAAELLTGAADSTVTRWRLLSGVAPEPIESDDRWHGVGVTAVGYSPDGSRRFSADREGRVVLWRRGGDEWTDRVTYRHGEVASGSPRITAAAMAGDRLAYGCDDGAVYEFAGLGFGATLPSGYLDARPERLIDIHSGRVNAVAYTPLGETIVSAGAQTLLVRDAPSAARTAKTDRKRRRRYHGAAAIACVAASDAIAFSSDADGRVVRWRIDVAPEAAVVEPENPSAELVAARAMANAGVAAADADGLVRRYPGGVPLAAGHTDHRDLRATPLRGGGLVTIAADHRACVWGDDGLLVRRIDLGGRTVTDVDADARTVLASTDGRDPIDGGPAARVYPIDGGAPTPLWSRPLRVSAIRASGDGVVAGLRDGQVFRWNASRREDFGRSSARPHRRAITAIAFTAQSAPLTADAGGLVVRWSANGGAPVAERRLPGGEIEALQTLPGDRFVARQRDATGAARWSWLTGDLGAAKSDVTAGGLRGVAADSERAVALTERGFERLTTGPGRSINAPGARVLEWDGLAVRDADLIAWRCGLVARWRETDGVWRALPGVASRPRSVALLADESFARVVSPRGVVTRWERGAVTPQQSRLPIGGEAIAACPAGPGRAAVAVAVGPNACAIELWDTRSSERVAVLERRIDARPAALGWLGDRVAVATSDRVLIVGERVRPRVVGLPAGLGDAVSLAVSSDGRRLAVRSAAGRVALGWADGSRPAVLLDRDGVDSIALIDRADRLLIGSAGGRIELLGVTLPAGDPQIARTRPLLAFADHSDRVTVLRVERGEGGEARLVSGDASGRVVVRPL